MKTLELTNLPSPVLLVWGLPECTKDIFCSYNGLSYKMEGGHHKVFLFPDGRWQLIGKLSELTEEDCKGMVHSVPYEEHRDSRREVIFNNYNSMSYKNTALESFHSAIEAEGYFLNNPYGKKEDLAFEGNASMIMKWQSAQSKTLPANTLIFKKA